MKTVSFNVKLPDKCYKFALVRKNKCTIIESIDGCDAAITRSITPNQLTFAIKELNLLAHFRQWVFNQLKHINSTVLFCVVEPNGGLIDYAW